MSDVTQPPRGVTVERESAPTDGAFRSASAPHESLRLRWTTRADRGPLTFVFYLLGVLACLSPLLGTTYLFATLLGSSPAPRLGDLLCPLAFSLIFAGAAVGLLIDCWSLLVGATDIVCDSATITARRGRSIESVSINDVIAVRLFVREPSSDTTSYAVLVERRDGTSVVLADFVKQRAIAEYARDTIAQHCQRCGGESTRVRVEVQSESESDDDARAEASSVTPREHPAKR